PPVPAATGVVSLWLLIRAFSSGCAAMTGVEAVSNGLMIFKEPRVRRGSTTLILISSILGLLLAGIAWLVPIYGIAAVDPDSPTYQTVVAMLVAAVMGRGAFYYITVGSILLALVVSCNTAFADFPRLCNLLAHDNFLPRSMAVRGRRLVFSTGIVGLAALAGGLLLAFGGITDRLIHLYAIGAFCAFTLSQAGMVVHWKRHPRPGSNFSQMLNGLGACLTGAATVVVLVAKFMDGAWLTLLIIPLLFYVFKRTYNHYARVAEETTCERPMMLQHLEEPVVVIPIKSWSTITEKALRFALRVGNPVIGVTVQMGEADLKPLQEQWDTYVAQPMRAAGMMPPPLIVLPSPFRSLFRPMHEYIKGLLSEYPDRTIAVIIPELAETRWYQHFLHNQQATWLKAALLLWGEQRVAVINVPWFLHKRPEYEEITEAKMAHIFSES
ncbi:MAG: amino acid permease, partial [Candidatus Xenobia bacterium]